MIGVHGPAPHPKSPIWQRTETGSELKRRVTTWLPFNLLKEAQSDEFEHHENFILSP